MTEAGCTQERDQEWHQLAKYRFLEVAIVGVVPIPFGWLAVYGLIWLVRWVRHSSQNRA